MSESKISTFPDDRNSALAMLYVQLHATKESTPEDLVDMYVVSLHRIRRRFTQKCPPVLPR